MKIELKIIKENQLNQLSLVKIFKLKELYPKALCS